MTGFTCDGRAVSRGEFDRVALDPHRSVVIRACAGSGKTWLLVSRLVRLLLAGAKPGEILAITFTRKAAQEMQARLLELLESLALAPEDVAMELLTTRGLDPASARQALPRARGLLEAVLNASVPMTVETFHGWFARIVKGAPLVAGVPAGFSLVERTAELKDRARRAFLAALDRDSAHFTSYCELLERVGEHSTRELLKALLSRRNEWCAFLDGGSLEAGLERLGFEIDSERDEQGRPLRDARKRLWQDVRFATSLRAVAAALSEGTPTEKKGAEEVLSALEVPYSEAAFDSARRLILRENGNTRHPTKEARRAQRSRSGAHADDRLAALVETTAQQVRDALDAFDEEEAFALNRSLWTCARVILKEYAALKEAMGVLDFDDLEWMAYGLSKDESTAAYVQTRLDARYRHVLVDEFQDTNPLQWITLRSWLEAYGQDASRPSVLLVGDPLQSIYRFRGAEPRLFEEAGRFLRANFDAIELSTHETRRCAPEIVALLNASFASEAPSDFQAHRTQSEIQGATLRLPLAGSVAQAELALASADNATFLDDPAHIPLRDALTVGPTDPEVQRQHEEARNIASAIGALVGHRSLEGGKESGKEGRVARYRDVLVLVRKRAGMSFLESAFRDAQIPYTSDRTGGLLGTLEARDLAALLRFLVVPFSDHVLAHVLRTPIFSVPDTELVRLARLSQAHSARSWWLCLQELPKDDRLHDAARLLASWVGLAGVRPVHDLLDQIYYEGEVIEKYVASLASASSSAPGEQVRANLLAFMELALQMDSGRYPSLPRFIAELDALAEGLEQESPDEGAADFGDTVRILTIHGAKGLESPIVILAGTAGAGPPARSHQILLDWPSGADRPSHFSAYATRARSGPSRTRLLENDARLDALEERNLLYVAVTRAKEVLVLSGTQAKRGDVAGSWYTRCAPHCALWELDADGSIDDVPQGASSGFVMVRDFRPKPIQTGLRIPIEGVHALGTERARLYGTVLHRLLEVYSEQRWDGVDALSIAQRQGLEPKLAQEAVRHAQKILSDPSLRRFFDASSYICARNEVELLTAEGEVIRIDRLVEFAHETWILDYKSHSSALGIDPHRDQLERYRGILACAAPKSPIRAGIIFGDAVLIEVI